MKLEGKLIAESPIYRGNAVKTLFTRDGDGSQKLVSLPGQIEGTAQSLMDAFIGQYKNGKNKGLLNRNWERLYSEPMPNNLISDVHCTLVKERYPKNGFFDLRMGLTLDEDRWAAKAKANYKMETVFRNAVFDFSLTVNEVTLSQDQNRTKLFYLLQEMAEGRFWFGAGKTKGLGNLRLEMDLSSLESSPVPSLKKGINHLRLTVFFDCMNPVLVGWNWGKKDPNNSSDDPVTDIWIDNEVEERKIHIKIKKMIEKGQISESQWGDKEKPPKEIDAKVWEAFLNHHKDKDTHKPIRFQYMKNKVNLKKSIANDQNFIDFVTSYREKTQEELRKDHHIDFRAGGENNREISRKYGKPYDKIFMRMLTWTPAKQNRDAWEIYIPGSTIKGAFRKRASQLLKTLMREDGANRLLDILFGRMRQGGKVFFSDAYLTDPIDHEKAWCSMDGVRMDPQKGRPIDKSKQDCLFGYGKDLKFRFYMDIQDINENDLQALSVLWHLLGDSRRGDIPFGGERNSGFGWVKTETSQVTWLTSGQDSITARLFGDQSLKKNGIWQEITLQGPEANKVIQPSKAITNQNGLVQPPRAKDGFISHRSFGGHCGILSVEAEVLTPLSIRESGAPSYAKPLNNKTVNGWDFFSISPPDSAQRSPDRIYALPSRSIKGMLRHIYSIATDSRNESTDISKLNPVDSLFGWVGKGENQALAGRISVSFGLFNNPQLSWYETKYPYGHLQYIEGVWEEVKNSEAKKTKIADYWRVFPHTRSLAPVVKRLNEFEPSDENAIYMRAIMPGSIAKFSIRFWNLLEEELQRLLWCIMLESNLAHKMGNGRYLGFGSVRFRFIGPCFLIDWSKRYAEGSKMDWKKDLSVKRNPSLISHYEALKKELDARACELAPTL